MNSSLFWCIIGIIGGAIFSFIISYFFYIKSLKRKQLTYMIDTFCLISDKTTNINELNIEYNSYKINCLYLSSITITNVGNSIINKEDFSQPTLISFDTDGIFINNNFQNSTINSNNDQVTANLIYNKNENNLANKVNIDINYFAKNTQLKYELIHTGKINFHGALKDGKIINLNELHLKRQHNTSIVGTIGIIFIITIGVMCILLQMYQRLYDSALAIFALIFIGILAIKYISHNT